MDSTNTYISGSIIDCFLILFEIGSIPSHSFLYAVDLFKIDRFSALLNRNDVGRILLNIRIIYEYILLNYGII
jgi:hypothetical protein